MSLYWRVGVCFLQSRSSDPRSEDESSEKQDQTHNPKYNMPLAAGVPCRLRTLNSPPLTKITKINRSYRGAPDSTAPPRETHVEKYMKEKTWKTGSSPHVNIHTNRTPIPMHPKFRCTPPFLFPRSCSIRCAISRFTLRSGCRLYCPSKAILVSLFHCIFSLPPRSPQACRSILLAGSPTGRRRRLSCSNFRLD